jgi:hypothetical protein
MNEKKNELLKKIYYDPSRGLGTVKSLYDQVKPNITLDEVKSFISSQEVSQLHRSTNKKKIFYPIVGDKGTYQKT